MGIFGIIICIVVVYQLVKKKDRKSIFLENDRQLADSREMQKMIKKEERQKWDCEIYVYAVTGYRKYLKEEVEEYFREEIRSYISNVDSQYYSRGIELESKFKLTDYILHYVLGKSTSKLIILNVFKNFKKNFHDLERQGWINIDIKGSQFHAQLNDNVFTMKMNNEIVLQFSFVNKNAPNQTYLPRYEVNEIIVFRVGDWILDFLNYNREMLISNIKEIESMQSIADEQAELKKLKQNENFKPLLLSK